MSEILLGTCAILSKQPSHKLRKMRAW